MSRGGRISLGEIMGAKGGKECLTCDDLPDLLGEGMPKLEYTPVGRIRLLRAIRNRFGANFRNLPGIEDALKDFDEQATHNVKLQQMKMIGRK